MKSKSVLYNLMKTIRIFLETVILNPEIGFTKINDILTMNYESLHV